MDGWMEGWRERWTKLKMNWRDALNPATNFSTNALRRDTKWERADVRESKRPAWNKPPWWARLKIIHGKLLGLLSLAWTLFQRKSCWVNNHPPVCLAPRDRVAKSESWNGLIDFHQPWAPFPKLSSWLVCPLLGESTQNRSVIEITCLRSWHGCAANGGKYSGTKLDRPINSINVFVIRDTKLI